MKFANSGKIKLILILFEKENYIYTPKNFDSAFSCKNIFSLYINILLTYFVYYNMHLIIFIIIIIILIKKNKKKRNKENKIKIINFTN